MSQSHIILYLEQCFFAGLCDALPNNIPNGGVQYNQPQYDGQYRIGTKASYHCDYYHVRSSGPFMKTCQPNSQWTSIPLPVCIGKGTYCSIPSSCTFY